MYYMASLVLHWSVLTTFNTVSENSLEISKILYMTCIITWNCSFQCMFEYYRLISVLLGQIYEASRSATPQPPETLAKVGTDGKR